MKTTHIAFSLIAFPALILSALLDAGSASPAPHADWSPFISEPPLELKDAILAAEDFLRETEKLGAGMWVLFEPSETDGNLIFTESKEWVWKLDFIFEPADVWTGFIPARSIYVSMNRACRYASSEKRKTEPNKAMETTPVNVTMPAIAGLAPFTSVSHL
jgi:hypothetical protein